MKLAALLLLSGCSLQPIQGEPLTMVCVAPVWSTPSQIRARCGADAEACGQIGQYNGQLLTMWVEQPDRWDDAKMARLGHEFAHALGLKH